MKVHFLMIGILIIAVLGAGCSDQSGSGTATPVPATTAVQPKFIAGDIIAKTATSTDTFWMIVKYDTKTDKYERALAYKKSDSSWYRKDNKTELAERQLTEKVYPAKVSHVSSISAVSITTPTATATTRPAQVSEPSISGITPSSGTSGMSAGITDLAGEHFQSGATVKLVGVDGASVKASNIVVTDTKITCFFNLYGLLAGHYSVVVTNPDGGSDILTNGFAVNEPGPVVSSIAPSEGMIGQTIDLTITGSNFKTPAKVLFNKGTTELEGANVVVSSATQIKCVLMIPTGTATGPWSITVRNVLDKQNGTALSSFTINNAT
jgi:hypothetical protein